MKRILLAILILFTSLMSVIPVYGQDRLSEKKEITRIFNASNLTEPFIIALGDAENQLEETLQKRLLQPLGGFTQGDKESVELELDGLDTTSVNRNREGTYTAVIKLKMPGQYADQFFISDQVRTLKVPVHIADPDHFTVYPTFQSDQVIYFGWLYPHIGQKAYVIESPVSLSDKQLRSATWKLCTDDLIEFQPFLHLRKAAILFSSRLMDDTHYYFKMASENGKLSNITHIIKSGDTIITDDKGGDRDGGDSSHPPVQGNDPNNKDKTATKKTPKKKASVTESPAKDISVFNSYYIHKELQKSASGSTEKKEVESSSDVPVYAPSVENQPENSFTDSKSPLWLPAVAAVFLIILVSLIIWNWRSRP